MRRITLHQPDGYSNEEMVRDLENKLQYAAERTAAADPTFKSLDRAHFSIRRQIEKAQEAKAKAEADIAALRKAIEPIHIALNDRRKELGMGPTYLAW